MPLLRDRQVREVQRIHCFQEDICGIQGLSGWTVETDIEGMEA